MLNVFSTLENFGSLIHNSFNNQRCISSGLSFFCAQLIVDLGIINQYNLTCLVK
ncbi:MAG: hypothetical protein RL064_90 [Bacteroidota bacterium]|jgi:hypothetical protein